MTEELTLDIADPYAQMLDDLENATGSLDDELSVALQNVIEQNYQQFDQARRQQEQQLQEEVNVDLDVDTDDE